MPNKDINQNELRDLTEVFRQAGATDPESWAHSQLAEGIPQLAIFSFAKALWNGVLEEGTVEAWINSEIDESTKRPNDPCAQIGPALREMVDKGVAYQSISDLVRVVQYLTLYHACALLDGSIVEDVPVTDWMLHQVDENGKPIAIIQGLHEVLLSMDPTGREMFPSKKSN